MKGPQKVKVFRKISHPDNYEPNENADARNEIFSFNMEEIDNTSHNMERDDDTQEQEILKLKIAFEHLQNKHIELKSRLNFNEQVYLGEVESLRAENKSMKKYDKKMLINTQQE